MQKTGLIQVYTSHSARQNFAPVGLSLRAAGQKMRVFMSCFLHHEFMEGAVPAAASLSPYLEIDHSAADGLPPGATPPAQRLRQAFEKARSAVLGGAYDLVIFNNLGPVLGPETIRPQEVLGLAEGKPGPVEVVFSGRDLPRELIDRADLVTEMVVSPDPAEKPLSQVSGEIEVITGNGKGKTTYCLGKSLLVSSQGVPALILQFMKSPQPYGEVKAIRTLPNLAIKTMGVGFFFDNTPESQKKHREAARRAWELCLREIFSLKYGLVVLDEINTATYYGLVNGERLREMLFLKPRGLQLLLSGRNAHAEVAAAATRVIEMREIRHPYTRGIAARKGIEF